MENDKPVNTFDRYQLHEIYTQMVKDMMRAFSSDLCNWSVNQERESVSVSEVYKFSDGWVEEHIRITKSERENG